MMRSSLKYRGSDRTLNGAVLEQGGPTVKVWGGIVLLEEAIPWTSLANEYRPLAKMTSTKDTWMFSQKMLAVSQILYTVFVL